jgi:hypothetical protein
MIDLDEFRKYLDIDKNHLDDELIRQPRIFEQVGDALADANARKDVLKEGLATVDAELDGLVRKYLDEKGDKYTEAVVKNAVQADRKHRAAFVAHNEAKLKADKLWVLKDALEQRGKALEHLCKLYLGGYYQQDSVRSVPADVQYGVRRSRLAQARVGAFAKNQDLK